MVTTRRAAARARGEAEPRKMYAEEDDEVGVEFEEGKIFFYKRCPLSEGTRRARLVGGTLQLHACLQAPEWYGIYKQASI